MRSRKDDIKFNEYLLRFRFDKDLYLKLIKEGVDKNKLPDTEPKIDFSVYDIENAYILGEFDHKLNLIKINVFGNLLNVLSKKPDEQLKNNYKRRLIETLAHEAGHWRLQKFEPWLNIEKWALFRILVLIHTLMALTVMNFLWAPVFLPCKTLISKSMAFLFIILLVLAIQTGGLVMSNYLTYRLNTDERRARKFAKNAEKDPRWQNVIIME